MNPKPAAGGNPPAAGYTNATTMSVTNRSPESPNQRAAGARPAVLMTAEHRSPIAALPRQESS